MVQHVWERAARARSIRRLVVATDDERIAAAVRAFGGEVRLTRPDHASGTDRVAEVAAGETAEWIVNVQGDEPLIDPEAIEQAVEGLRKAPEAGMATLRKRIDGVEELADPNVVKVVCDRQGRALYFSRSLIPFPREGAPAACKHVGLYVYRRDFLLRYPGLPVGPLERAEKLEQLRALENGFRIQVAETAYDSLGVDTPADLERVRARIEANLAVR